MTMRRILGTLMGGGAIATLSATYGAILGAVSGGLAQAYRNAEQTEQTLIVGAVGGSVVGFITGSALLWKATGSVNFHVSATAGTAAIGAMVNPVFNSMLGYSIVNSISELQIDLKETLLSFTAGFGVLAGLGFACYKLKCASRLLPTDIPEAEVTFEPLKENLVVITPATENPATLFARGQDVQVIDIPPVSAEVKPGM